VLRQAFEKAPTYALALALRAQCVWTTIASGWLGDTGPANAEMIQMVRLALAHGGDDPEILAWVSGGVGVSAPLRAPLACSVLGQAGPLRIAAVSAVRQGCHNPGIRGRPIGTADFVPPLPQVLATQDRGRGSHLWA
jgi:hypothetical protein